MRHFKIGRKLNRNSSHRLSLMRNMSVSLIYYNIIKTTLFKAKELRRFIEPVITFSKIDNISNRRLVFSRIPNSSIVFKLFNKLGPKYKMRNGGYIKILKCGFRLSDNTNMAYVKFV